MANAVGHVFHLNMRSVDVKIGSMLSRKSFGCCKILELLHCQKLISQSSVAAFALPVFARAFCLNVRRRDFKRVIGTKKLCVSWRSYVHSVETFVHLFLTLAFKTQMQLFAISAPRQIPPKQECAQSHSDVEPAI